MKFYILCLCCALGLGANAQTATTKTYAAHPGEKVNLKFDYPVVKLSTWDKNEVEVVAHVNINDHENDSSFVLEEETVNGTLVINGHIKAMDKLPRRYVIINNGKKMIFRSKDEYQKAARESGAIRSYEGSDIDIVLEVKLPANTVTDIRSVYGIVELNNFNASATVDATYGGIDATLTTARTGKLMATTNYGQIYSNLDLKLTDHKQGSFFNSITAEPGKGAEYSFTSAYGKIYLRKP